MRSHEPTRHVVVLDCNVYLDVADMVGEPFRWSEFDRIVAGMARDAVPHPRDRALDSARAIAVSTSGWLLPGDEPLEVWSSAHIDRLVGDKARQPRRPDERGLRGLGWSDLNSDHLVDELVGGVVTRSNGDRVEQHRPEGNPPLDHEDGMVFGACHRLASDDPLARIYCVTRDRGFLSAHREGRLPLHTAVLSPSQFVEFVRRARAAHSVRRMPRPPV